MRPFDALLSVQSPVPSLFTKPALRSAAAGRLWREIVVADGDFPLSDIDRDNFEKDLRRTKLLDGQSEIGSERSKGVTAK
jgi:hypothetical protein